MIFICSDSNDFSTTQVIKWINYFGKKYIRFNEEDRIKLVKTIGLNDFIFEIQSDLSTERFRFSQIQAYWYRRGGINLSYHFVENDKLNSKEINQYLWNESFAITNFIERLLEDNTLYSIGKQSFNYINKLSVLRKAAELKLDVPKTIVTTTKADLQIFYNENQHVGIVTKDMHHPLNIKFSDTEAGVLYTSEISQCHIDVLPEFFFSTKFQEKLDKDFEIRTFFIGKNTYSMAIFSQNDDKTKIDFRKYNNAKPNRTPPYNLPDNVKKKLIQLMSNIGLNSGSIDIVYTKDKRFVFLEVNPIGQFDQLSYPCNYNIEKIIANYLINGK